jgi:hypothetical protein
MNVLPGLQDANGVIGIGHRHDLISSPIQSLSISDCDPRAAVVIALSLRRQYLQNGNIRGRGWRLSAIAAPRLPNWESGDEIERAESGRLRPISRFRGNLTERRNAGWGGRIRTSAWWNQNQAGPSTKSTRILNHSLNLTPCINRLAGDSEWPAVPKAETEIRFRILPPHSFLRRRVSECRLSGVQQTSRS